MSAFGKTFLLRYSYFTETPPLFVKSDISHKNIGPNISAPFSIGELSIALKYSLELELIQTQTAQKPMLREGLYARPFHDTHQPQRPTL